MIIISQRDPRWGNAHIGDSPLLIKDYGCTLTSLSMISDYFKMYHDPLQMMKCQSFTPEGLIIWESLHLGQMKFEKRLRTRNDAEIQRSIADPNKAVLLEFQLPSTKHWCVALSKVPLLDRYNFADPWFGDKATPLRYKNNIVGSAHYTIN